MKYPKYLSIGNSLFKHLEPDWFYQNDRPVGGLIPENLYIAVSQQLNLSRGLRTYEGLIEYGCTEPSNEELLRLIKQFCSMVQIDLYKKGTGVIKKFSPVLSEREAQEFIDKYCQEHNVYVVAHEYCEESHWNYLSDGTEIDYTLE